MSATLRQHDARAGRFSRKIADLLYCVRSCRALAADCLAHGEHDEASRHRDRRTYHAKSLRRLIQRHPEAKDALRLIREKEARNV